MPHFKEGVQKMDKKEITKEESKSKEKQEVKKQEYNVAEFVQQAAPLFQTKPECVIAAFQIAGAKTATEEQAKKNSTVIFRNGGVIYGYIFYSRRKEKTSRRLSKI